MKTVVRSAAFLTLALCAGCSSFHKKWDAAGQPGKYRNAAQWEGRWTSAYHKTPAGSPAGGRLRCVIEPVSDARILAHFHANWLSFSADYSVPFEVTLREHGASVAFRGTQKLPEVFGGIYRYDARISGDRFSARYTSSYDAGTFEMTRQLTNAARIR